MKTPVRVLYKANPVKNFPRGGQSHPRSSSGSIFAIIPAKCGFSGLLSRLQPFPSFMLQRWRDDGAFCVDVPSNRRGGQPSSKGDFSEREKREGGGGVHTIAPWVLGRFWQTIRRWKALRRVQKACAGMRGYPGEPRLCRGKNKKKSAT